MSNEIADMELGDYWAILRRRIVYFLVPFVLILGTAITIAFVLPAKYRSEATLQIERQTIPVDLVETTVTGYVQERIQQITQLILTYDNMLQLAEKHDLHTDLLEKDPGQVTRLVREAFEVDMVDVKASDPDRVGTREATIAFTVSFSAPTPEQAQALTAEMTDRYLSEHEAQRTAAAGQVSEFIETEAVKLEKEIDEMEEQLADFKQINSHTLPEMKEVNIALLRQAENDIDYSNERVRTLEDRIIELNADLSTTPKFKDVEGDDDRKFKNAQDRLAALVSEYMRATSIYSSKHPDVRRLAREIRILTEQTGTSGRVDELMSELVGVQEELRQANQVYGPEHPTVVRLERSVAALQEGFATALASDLDTVAKAAPNNPEYIRIQAQLETAESSLSAARSKRREQEVRQREIEDRLFRTPQVESEYTNLTRALDSLVGKYRELTNKEFDSNLAIQLEAGEAGQRFSLLSAAYKPVLPESPNRIGIALLGALIAGVLSLLLVALVEYFDKAIYSVRTVTNTLGAPPLAVIPKIA